MLSTLSKNTSISFFCNANNTQESKTNRVSSRSNIEKKLIKSSIDLNFLFTRTICKLKNRDNNGWIFQKTFKLDKKINKWLKIEWSKNRIMMIKKNLGITYFLSLMKIF